MTSLLRHPIHLVVLACVPLAQASCVGEEEFCGGFESTVNVDVVVQRLTLNIDDTRPVQAEICLSLPRECPCLTTDANGQLRAALPAESDVLVEIRAPRFQTTLGITTTGSVDRLASLRLIDQTTIGVLASVIHEDLDPTLGHIGLRVSPAEGASVVGSTFVLRHLDTGTEQRVIYTDGGIPTLDATSSDDTGSAVGVNLPVGRYRLESPTLPTCELADAGWPRYDTSGRLEAIELEVRADAVTLIDVLRCHAP